MSQVIHCDICDTRIDEGEPRLVLIARVEPDDADEHGPEELERDYCAACAVTTEELKTVWNECVEKNGGDKLG